MQGTHTHTHTHSYGKRDDEMNRELGVFRGKIWYYAYLKWLLSIFLSNDDVKGVALSLSDEPTEN